MNIDTLNEVRDRSIQNDLTNEVETNKLNNNIESLNEELQNYLYNNKEPNFLDKIDSKIPIDFDLETSKNELGDTTILGKITIEKSAMKDIEKFQNKVENIKDKGISFVKKGLDKVYDAIKGTFVEKVAEKILNVGGKVLSTASKAIGTIGRKILKI